MGEGNDRPISRRQLLRRGGAIGGGALLGEVALGGVAREAWALAEGGEAAAKLAPMPRRVLGKTGEKIPILLQGGSMTWDVKWDPKLPESLKNGIDYFDAAWNYSGGTNELAIGSFLERTKATAGAARDKLWITTKAKSWDPAGAEQQLNES